MFLTQAFQKNQEAYNWTEPAFIKIVTVFIITIIIGTTQSAYESTLGGFVKALDLSETSK